SKSTKSKPEENEIEFPMDASWEEIMTMSPEDAPFKKRETSGIMEGTPDTVPRAFRQYPRLKIDESANEKHNLHTLRGKRILLVTDMPLTPAVRALPKAADEAFEQLCDYFDARPDDDWYLTMYLMKDNIPFMQAGYLPEILPPFKNGFSFNYDAWLYDQPSDYYRQHLLIHEMVHSFCNTVLGSVGPAWYAEGMAELLGMHDFQASPVELRFMPPTREAVPHCGRIKEIHDAIERGEARTFHQTFVNTNEDFRTNAVYYWSWAMANFLDRHPDTQAEFRALPQLLKESVAESQFTPQFLENLGEKVPQLEKQWLMYVSTFDYGYNLAPMLFDTTRGEPIRAGEKKLASVEATRGWQNTLIHVKKGDRLRIRAKGRFELYQPEGVYYPCEANGITIRYHDGAPLGILSATILTDADSVSPEIMNDHQDGTFFAPFRIGLDRTIVVPFDGTLLLRINDSSASLERNRGKLTVEISHTMRGLSR
ncbi:MAG: hypothetical protein Q4D38_10585, partial [Planctomycetia bacterium]|nr:hypothetical protein [Planctomycetia bacterium]